MQAAGQLDALLMRRSRCIPARISRRGGVRQDAVIVPFPGDNGWLRVVAPAEGL